MRLLETLIERRRVFSRQMKTEGPLRIAVAMIVRDAAETLEACLASVRPHVDEVNIYLAGESSDETVAIVERLALQPGPPIRSIGGEWRDDFAWARNESFAMVSSDADWIMYCDADDVLHDGEHLRPAIAEAVATTPHVNALSIPYLAVRADMAFLANSIAPAEEGNDVWWQPFRLLRNDRVWVWASALHERLVGFGGRHRCYRRIPIGVCWFEHTRQDWVDRTQRNIDVLERQIADGKATALTTRQLAAETDNATWLGELREP